MEQGLKVSFHDSHECSNPATGCSRENGAVRGMLLEILNLCGFLGAGRCFITKALSELQHDSKGFRFEKSGFPGRGDVVRKTLSKLNCCLANNTVLRVCVLGLLFLS